MTGRLSVNHADLSGLVENSPEAWQIKPDRSNRIGWFHLPHRAWLVVGGYVALALAYNVVFPPFEPTDEWAHFRYVRFLVDERRFPVAQPNDTSEYHQPPLYYALAAALAWPFKPEGWEDYNQRVNPYRAYRYWESGLDNKNLFLHGPWDAWPFRGVSLSVHVARLASLGLGFITVLFTFQMARALLTENDALAVTALVAFQPMFLAVSGSLQNDAGAAACGAVCLCLGVRGYQAGFTLRRAMVLGLSIGLGLLMKITAAFLIPAAVVILLAWGRSQRQSFQRVGGYIAVMFLSALLSGGGWYARNQWLYGEPTAVNVNLQAYGGRTLLQGMAVWWQALPYAWTTFWGRFGHGDVVLPSTIYAAIGWACGLAVIGWGLHLWRARPMVSAKATSQPPSFQRIGSGKTDKARLPSVSPLESSADSANRAEVIFLATAGVGEFIGLLGYLTLSPSGYMGRYTFPALPAYMLLLLLGWQGLALGHQQIQAWITRAFPTAMFGLAVWAFGAYIFPVYTAPPALAHLPAGAQPLEATLGDVARLRGYALNPQHAQPGDVVDVTLYWEPLGPTALPYSIYLHLFDGDETLVAQRDTYPGLGRYPTTAWQPGHLFADRYRVALPETTYAPVTAQWEAGLWQTQTGDRAFVLDETGQPVAAGVRFGALTIEARAGTTPNPTRLNFGNQINLVGYSLAGRTLRPGQPVELTLYWDRPQPLSVFVHVTDAGGNLWANTAMEINAETQTVQSPLAADVPPGIYDVVVGVVAGETQSRLKLMGDDGHEIDDKIRLTGLRIMADP